MLRKVSKFGDKQESVKELKEMNMKAQMVQSISDLVYEMAENAVEDAHGRL